MDDEVKIVDVRGTATRFDDIDVGDYFYEDGEPDARRLDLKVPVGKDGVGSPFNAVCLNTGNLCCYTKETRVQVVEVEITVLKNVAGR